MKRRAGLCLVGFALVCESVYLAATLRLPWWQHAGSLPSWRRILAGSNGIAAPATGEAGILGACVVAIALLAMAYAGSWYVATNEPYASRVVLAGAILFSATLVWLLPITSDLFGYLGQAHLMTDLGMNPLVRAAIEAPPDAVLQSFATVYSGTPSNYGPAWLLVASLGTLGRDDGFLGLLYLKMLGLAAYLVSVWLLSSTLAQARRPMAAKGVVLFAWNPLILLLAVGDGHNDMVMMAAVLLAMWLLLRRRWTLAIGALIFSIWVKYVSVILLPLFLLYAVRSRAAERRDAARRSPGFGQRLRGMFGAGPGSVLAQSSLATVAVSALVLFPFGGLAWLPRAVERLLQPRNVLQPLSALSLPALGAGFVLFILVYCLVAFRFVRGTNSFDRLSDAAFSLMLLAFLLGAARSQPWHLIWAAALAPLSGYRWAPSVIAGLSVLMLVALVWVEWGAPGLGVAP